MIIWIDDELMNKAVWNSIYAHTTAFVSSGARLEEGTQISYVVDVSLRRE